ncbi:uncharacterized protein LOC129268163 [Lytechinus pictus]|uniref:uncharacterized protein LOC129268163 n=1 Tax=Lytechinus pictus TaxID=7653 RepID=UPI0030B9E819
MPRRHSSKKPGCFNQVKHSLMFTESPPERLPKRLCSPTNAADNPITAQVLYLEDGLETTWVSPQFNPAMLEMEEPPRRRRRKKQDGNVTGKSAMASQPTTKKQRPVRKSTLTTPNPDARRFNKGIKPLKFLGDSSRKGMNGQESRMSVLDDLEADLEDVRIDDGDEDVWSEDSAVFKKEDRRRRSSAKGVLQRLGSGEGVGAGFIDYSRTLHDVSHRMHKQGRMDTGRRSVTRSRISSARGSHDGNHHPFMDGDAGEGDFHQPGLTVLREKPLTSNTSGLHHTRMHLRDLSISPNNFNNLDDIDDRLPHEHKDYGQSPYFHKQKIQARGESARKKLKQFAAHPEQYKDTGLDFEDQQLLANLDKTGIDGKTKGRVLAADTPVSDYGLRVTLRRRRHLLPKHYTERLLLDS